MQKLQLLFYLFTFILISNISFGQDNQFKPSKKDSIIETIVYEYDTVYMPADTLRVIDTIIHIKSKQKKLNKNSPKISVGFGLYSYFTGLFDNDNSVDSFTYSRTPNINYELHLNFEFKKYIYSIGFGYTRLCEQLNYNKQQNNPQTASPLKDYYDSVLIYNNCQSKSFYNFVNVFLNFGRKWGRNKMFFSINGQVSAQFLINRSSSLPIDSQPKIIANPYKKYFFRIGFNPMLTYNPWKKLEIFIAPLCSYSVFNKKEYPISNRLIVGAGVGLNLKI